MCNYIIFEVLRRNAILERGQLQTDEPKLDNVAAIILAGGKGTRMGVPNKHKSTFEIQGVPAILRLITNLRAIGVDHIVVVTGAWSEQIMNTISTKYSDIAFVYQPFQRGTGNAAKYGIYYLKRIHFRGKILICMGDAYIESQAILELYQNANILPDHGAFLVKPYELSPFSGRILTKEDFALADIEYWDIIKYKGLLFLNELLNIPHVIELNSQHIIEIKAQFTALFPNKEKMQKMFSWVFDFIEKYSTLGISEQDFQALKVKIKSQFEASRRIFHFNSKDYRPEDVERERYVNVSVYLIQSQLLYENIEKILSNNAQNEEYLTDIIQILAELGCKLRIVPLKDPNEVMAFNNPNELLEINERVKLKELKESKQTQIQFQRKTVQAWINLFKNRDPTIISTLSHYYGISYPLIEQKIERFLTALEKYAQKFSLYDNVIIVRAPGRLNLMGRHVDHRGGDVNMLAIDQEVIIITSKREDDRIIAYNDDMDQYRGINFSIKEHLSMIEWTDWFNYITNKKIIEMVRESQGDWINYLKAAALRLQIAVPNTTIKGANMFFYGSVPVAAGLSSSSAIVVGTLETLIHFNVIQLSSNNYLDLCGEGEWFVGTRGGSSDHAAIKFSNPHQISRIGFFNFTIKDTTHWPEDYDILIINSMKKASKSNEMMKRFNEKVLSYEIGFEIFKRAFPQYQNKLKYLRDINPLNLNIDSNEIYEMLKIIPEFIEFSEINQYVSPEKHQEILKRFVLFQKADKIAIRSVVIYGICECIRSSRCMALIKENRIIELGKLMYISHDGDRVVTFTNFDHTAQPQNFTLTYSNTELDQFKQKKIPMEMISGSYACSIPEIDFIVDFMRSLTGVYGAQISGAGMGGCVMAITQHTYSNKIIAALQKQYHDKWGITPDIINTQPIHGASVFLDTED